MKTLNSTHFAVPYKEEVKNSVISANVYAATIETNNVLALKFSLLKTYNSILNICIDNIDTIYRI